MTKSIAEDGAHFVRTGRSPAGTEEEMGVVVHFDGTTTSNILESQIIQAGDERYFVHSCPEFASGKEGQVLVVHLRTGRGRQGPTREDCARLRPYIDSILVANQVQK